MSSPLFFVTSNHNILNMHTDNQEKTVIVKVFDDELTANLVKSKLADAGIDAILVNENVAGLNPLGGIELKVFETDLERAKQLVQERE